MISNNAVVCDGYARMEIGKTRIPIRSSHYNDNEDECDLDDKQSVRVVKAATIALHNVLQVLDYRLAHDDDCEDSS